MLAPTQWGNTMTAEQDKLRAELKNNLDIDSKNLLLILMRVALNCGLTPQETGEVLMESDRLDIKEAGQFLLNSIILSEQKN